MTIELSILLSTASVSFAIYMGMKNWNRNQVKDTKEEQSQMTTVLIKLESIKDSIAEVKNEVQGMKEDVKELRDRLIVVEQSSKSAHNRLDDLIVKAKDC